MTATVTSRLDQSATPEKVPLVSDSTVRRMSKTATIRARQKTMASVVFWRAGSCRP